MEAKELEMIISSAELRNPNVYNASRERYVAEISFKAGIREAVEWLELEEHWDYVDDCDNDHYSINRAKKQAKLKEWGL